MLEGVNLFYLKPEAPSFVMFKQFCHQKSSAL